MRRGFSDGVWVRGEIQGWNERGGHAYFSLCDDSPGRQAVVRVQFFAPARNRLRPLLAKHRLRLADGMKVRIFGHLDFYAPSGQLGLKMVDLDPRFTLGDLAQQRDQVLRRLAADGSLDANRRHRLGPVPLRLGIVASPGTAAWHDFHDELQRSGFGFHLVLAATRVQGPEAPRPVSRAVTALSHHARRYGLDAIVAHPRRRGAQRARHVRRRSDREGDRRLRRCRCSPAWATRSTAVSPTRSPTRRSRRRPRVRRRWSTRSVPTSTAVEHAFTAVGVAARATMHRTEAALVERSRRIAGRTHAAVDRADERLGGRVHRLRTGAHRPIGSSSRHLASLSRAVSATRAPQVLGAEERHLTGIEARVRALDPVNVLARGWTITRSAAGTIVRSPDDVPTGDVIHTTFAAGSVRSRVEDAEPDGREQP